MAAFAPERGIICNACSPGIADAPDTSTYFGHSPDAGSWRDRTSHSVSYHMLPLVRTFCTLLSPGIALFPVLFLFFSPVSTLLFSSAADIARVKINDPPPIVLVIFDEFSSISLMDEHHQIDAQRYPNFAAFAEEATWFRNASSMSTWTPRGRTGHSDRELSDTEQAAERSRVSTQYLHLTRRDLRIPSPRHHYGIMSA